MFGFITAKAQEALEALRPILDMTDVEYEHSHARLDSASLRLTIGSLVWGTPVSYTHLRAHETVLDLVCRLLLEKTKK